MFFLGGFDSVCGDGSRAADTTVMYQTIADTVDQRPFAVLFCHRSFLSSWHLRQNETKLVVLSLEPLNSNEISCEARLVLSKIL